VAEAVARRGRLGRAPRARIWSQIARRTRPFGIRVVWRSTSVRLLRGSLSCPILMPNPERSSKEREIARFRRNRRGARQRAPWSITPAVTKQPHWLIPLLVGALIAALVTTDTLSEGWHAVTGANASGVVFDDARRTFVKHFGELDPRVAHPEHDSWQAPPSDRTRAGYRRRPAPQHAWRCG
jgi:hypothetical protein